MQQAFSDQYIEDYMSHIGLANTPQNKAMALWALAAPIPAGWHEGTTPQGDLYFWRENLDGSKEVRWEHPIDEFLKDWIKQGHEQQAHSEVISVGSEKNLAELNNKIFKNEPPNRNTILQQVLSDRILQQQRQQKLKEMKRQTLANFELQEPELTRKLEKSLDLQESAKLHQHECNELDLVEKQIHEYQMQLNGKLLSQKNLEEKLLDQIRTLAIENVDLDRVKNKQILLDQEYNQLKTKHSINRVQKQEIESKITNKLIEFLCNMRTEDERGKENYNFQDSTLSCKQGLNNQSTTFINKSTYYDFINLF